MWHFDPSDKYRSEKSTTPEQLCDRKYTAYIQELRKQNEYKNKALETAQNLISTYKKQNQELRENNLYLQDIIRSKNEEIKLRKQMMCQNSQVKLKRKSEQKGSEEEKIKIEELSKQIVALLEDRKLMQEKIMRIEQKLLNLQENFNKKQITKQEDKAHRIQSLNHEKNQFSESFKDFAAKDNKFCKHKNLTQLRALHMKLKERQSQTYYEHKNNKLCELTTQVVQFEQKKFCTPLRVTKQTLSQNNSTKESHKKIHALSGLKRERSRKKSDKKLFK